jgi:hypothetical protein
VVDQDLTAGIPLLRVAEDARVDRLGIVHKPRVSGIPSPPEVLVLGHPGVPQKGLSE